MDGKTFAPIGNSDILFAGTFDGGNFSISNLTIDNPDAICQGLFGKTDKSAVIRRINLLNAHITGLSLTGGIVGQNLTITGNVTVDTANNFARLDGNSYVIVDNADIPNYSDLIQVYVLNLPECVNATGDILFSSNGTTYAAGDISLNPKIGYLVDDSNVNIYQDTDVEAHFDDKNHYVLADDTSTLANETNTADFPDLIQVWTVDGVNLAPADNIYLVGSDIYVKAGSTVSVDGKNFIINGDCDIATYIDQYGVQQSVIATEITVDESILNAGIYVAHGNLNLGTIFCRMYSEVIFSWESLVLKVLSLNGMMKSIKSTSKSTESILKTRREYFLTIMQFIIQITSTVSTRSVLKSSEWLKIFSQ